MTTNSAQCWIPTEHTGRPAYDCRRHDKDCLHFYPEGNPARHAEHVAHLAVNPDARVSYKREATPQEMSAIPACSTCGVDANRPTPVATCGRCYMELSSTGVCACDD